MPKRKLRLWYNKNDYLKEREEEKKQAEPTQNEDIVESEFIAKGEKTKPALNENKTSPIERNEVTSIEEKTKLLQNEPQNEISPSESQVIPQQAEALSEPPNTQDQACDKENKAQTEPCNDLKSTPPEIQQVVSENDLKTESTQKERQEESIVENVFPPLDEKQKEALIHLKWVKDQDKLADPLTRPNPEETIVPIETKVEPTQVEIVKEVPLTASVVNIEEYTDNLKRLLPTKAVVCIGEYPINIVLKGSVIEKRNQGVLPIFVEKSTEDVIKWSQGRLDKNNIVCLDENIDTHFWYDILPYGDDNESFFAKMKNEPIEKLQGIIIVSSIWNGIGSALLPRLSAQFKERGINSIGLPLLPSNAQPLDGQFNAFASLGILASKETTTLLLLDRDNIESYIGVDRNGYAINGNEVINYLLDIMLSKVTFVGELCEISKTFGSKMFTVLLASGLSLKIYGSIENMLNTTLLRPLFTFEIGTSTMLYVMIRMPFHLKDTLSRGKIELSIANWFKDKADLESIYIADPIYLEEPNDRIDVALFLGGFDTVKRFEALEKRVEKMKNRAVKKGSITEEDWQLITKSLVE